MADAPSLLRFAWVRATRAPQIPSFGSLVTGLIMRPGSRRISSRRAGGIADAMADAGEDLLRIRDQGTWRHSDTRAESFHAYCRERWGLKRKAVDALIRAAERRRRKGGRR